MEGPVRREESSLVQIKWSLEDADRESLCNRVLFLNSPLRSRGLFIASLFLSSAATEINEVVDGHQGVHPRARWNLNRERPRRRRCLHPSPARVISP